MGGQIRVIIREEDGKIHKQSRWTNALPGFVKTLKFYTGDKNYINQYLNGYNNSSYKSNVESLSPSQYGIVILDLKDKWIGSLNGYCGFDGYDISGLLITKDRVIDDNGRVDMELAKEVLKTEYNEFYAAWELFNAGFLTFINEIFYKDNTREYVNIEVKEFTGTAIDKIYNRGKSSLNKLRKKLTNSDIQYEYQSAKIDYEKIGWTYNSYAEDTDGNISLFKNLISRGFIFDNNDLSDWQDFIDEHYSEDDDSNYNSGVIKSTHREVSLNKVL
jgi:hypothetical protein